ncbi:hypothetical protein T12_8278 [Trichinella patagoniensis]|uniref:Uncharacterized protein n=1 Tax=Trichinella patagoniensis TaxID=990121 RepID=A0A0V0ZU46_9BILA|nr:hypothetical protein T12_8278 [Trichinella patagoniensis]
MIFDAKYLCEEKCYSANLRPRFPEISEAKFSEQTVASALIVSYVVLRDWLQLKNLSQTTYRMQRMLQYYFHHIFRVTSGLRWPHPTSAW